MKILNVAEKNNIANTISNILSNGQARRRSGRGKAKVYEFPFEWRGQRVEMVFTAVAGHLMDYDFTDRHRKWHSCEPSELFTAPIQSFVPDTYSDYQATLRKEAKGCQHLMLWLDCDREGEAIAFEVMEVCLGANRRLQVSRPRFASVVPAEIRRAIAEAGEPNRNEADAVQCRRELDLRIGAAWTRLQSMRWQNMFANLGSMLSFGPCQFPTLGFVVHRYERAIAFRPEDFWSINVTVKRTEGEATFAWDRVRLFDRLAVIIHLDVCMESPKAVVVHCATKPCRKYRPFPLTTVTMQKVLSRRYRMSAQSIMNVAEKLYMDGYISYPRTETDSFPPDQDLTALVRLQASDGSWGAYATRLLDGGYRAPKRGRSNDNAHQPIHPVRHAANLQGAEKQVYDFVVRHFLACCSEDALGDETKVVIRIADEQFHCSGLAIRERNFLDVYPFVQWTVKTIPRFERGEQFVPNAITLSSGRTTAPSLLTESELIALMDEHGIGTDATIAQHIQTVQDREYVRQDGKYLTPTTLGMALIRGYDELGFDFSGPELRAQTEAELTAIAEGRALRRDVTQRGIQRYRAYFEQTLQALLRLDAVLARHFDRLGSLFDHERKNFSRCGACNNMMALRSVEAPAVRGKGQRGKASKKKSGFTKHCLHCDTCDTYTTISQPGQPEPSEHTCPLCQYQVITLRWRDRERFVCPNCLVRPPSTFVEQAGAAATMPCYKCSADCALASKQPPAQDIRPCAACGAAMQLRVATSDAGKRYYVGCSAYPACRSSFNLPRCRSVKVTPDTCSRCVERGYTACKLLEVALAPELMSDWASSSLTTRVCIGGCSASTRRVIQDVNNGRSLNALWLRGANSGTTSTSTSTTTMTRSVVPHRTHDGGGTVGTSGGRGRGAVQRRSGGGGGGGGGGACYQCGAEGHFASACPTQARGGTRNGQSCYSCGREGHFASSCPDRGSGGGRPQRTGRRQ